MGSRIVIGVTGLNGSGKGAFLDVLADIGYRVYSLSDMIREELAAEGTEPTRENLIQRGNEMRSRGGADVLARLVLDRIDLDGAERAAVDSIRNRAELDRLKTRDGFALVAITAGDGNRFERCKERGRAESCRDLAGFLEVERREFGEDPKTQQLDTVIRRAQFILSNDGTLEELEEKAVRLVRKIEHQGPGREASRSGARRVDWHRYFMNIAEEVSTRSTCDRKHVGCVIVRDKTILSTGYNGSIRGMPHCDDTGHMMEGDHCVATIHAEANAIIQAAKNGVSIDGAELYTTASPCWHCFKVIANAGIRTIYYAEFYRDERSLDVAQKIGISLVRVES